ncbi:MAG: hypothetical protein SPL05_00685 [Eubacteriales bacterium]|nr:hypothetical protein [Eubacteriales bacterium]
MLKKIKDMLQKALQSSYGADLLGKHTIILACVVYILAFVFKSYFLYFLAFLLYALAVFRMFSKNRIQRQKENQMYFQVFYGFSLKCKQQWNRLKNFKKYKYLNCPSCKTLIRIPRGSGKGIATCTKCKNKFETKA